MRFKFLYILAVFQLFLSVVSAQNRSSNSQIRIEPQTVDFGVIKEEDGVVKSVVTITNISNKPYILNYTSSSCGCAVIQMSKAPIMPGKSRDVNVSYDPARRPGVFSKNIFLVSNNKREEDIITLKGEVIPKPKTLQEAYPIEAIDGLILSGDKYPFGIIPSKERHTMKIGYYNSSDKSININFEIENKRDFESLEFYPEILKPGAMGEVRLTYDLLCDTVAFGDIRSEIDVIVNGIKWDRKFISNAMIMPNFFDMTNEERSVAPVAVIGVKDKTFKITQATNKVDYLFLLKNTGHKILRPLYVKVSDERVECVVAKKELRRGDECYIKVKVKTEGLSRGKHEFYVTLMFNAPDTPIELLKIVVDIQ